MRQDHAHKSVNALLLTVIAFFLIFPLQALALPTGSQVVSGEASISLPDTLNMNINQATDKVIINWNSFSIAQSESVSFFQPDASSIALNRVITADPSYIYGTLTANGQIYLINPAGILVGPSGVIDTAAFIGSTLDMADDDFLAGNYVFEQTLGSSLASIVNQGTIQAADGGFISLLAPGIENQGNIVANLGKVYMAGAERVVLNFAGNDLIGFEIEGGVREQVLDLEGDSLSSVIENSGTITADGGQVILSAESACKAIQSVVNNEGIIEARSLENENGVIRLTGGSKGIVYNSGTLDASGYDAGETGGTIEITGEKVGLVDSAQVDASGDQGGGTVHIGGGYQGSDEGVENAAMTYVGEDVTISADAVSAGDGGEVVVWSDALTRAYGTLSADGGLLGGDGGLIETSSAGYLDVQGISVSAVAFSGLAGTWLLDPLDVEIVDTISGNQVSEGSGIFDAGSVSSPAQVLSDDIESVLEADTNVTVHTGSTGGETGNITLSTDITVTLNSNVSLTLDAAGNIILNDDILASGDALDLIFNANSSAYDTESGSGGISLAGDIDTNGGSLTMELFNSGSGVIDQTSGTITAGATTVNAGASDVTLDDSDNVFGELDVTGGAVKITENADMTGSVTADSLDATAGGSIDLDTSVTDLLATAAEEITIDESDDVNLYNIVTYDGAITITSGGTMYAGEVLSQDGEIILTAEGGLEASAVASMDSGTTGDYDVTLINNNSGDVTIGQIQSDNDVIITSAGRGELGDVLQNINR